MAKIPDQYRDLFETKVALGHLATIMPDGSPQVNPVWFDVDGEQIRVNSAKGRRKDRNMRERSPVALEVLDPENPFRYAQARGRVVEITEEGANAHIDHLSQKYLGRDYPFHRDGEVRVIYKIAIERVSGMG